MIVDTHSHLQFDAFKADVQEVVKRTLAGGIWTINVGTKYETSRSAVELAEKHEEGVFAAIGLHPIYAAAEFLKLKTDPDEGEFLITEHEFDRQKYEILAQFKKVVAVGEIGLDYYYRPKSTSKLTQFKEKQKKIFLEQMQMAKDLKLPVILHCRMAHDDVISILKDNPGLKGVIHCFTGTLEQAEQYVALGFLIGINGIIYKFNIDEVIKNVSLDHMVVETDCPYLTPLPEAGKRNEPLFIKHTIARIADIKKTTSEQVAGKTTENARNIFGI